MDPTYSIKTEINPEELYRSSIRPKWFILSLRRRRRRRRYYIKSTLYLLLHLRLSRYELKSSKIEYYFFTARFIAAIPNNNINLIMQRIPILKTLSDFSLSDVLSGDQTWSWN